MESEVSRSVHGGSAIPVDGGRGGGTDWDGVFFGLSRCLTAAKGLCFFGKIREAQLRYVLLTTGRRQNRWWPGERRTL